MTRQSFEIEQVSAGSQILARLRAELSAKPAGSVFEGTVRLLRESSDHFDWVGIYLANGDTLELAAYAGEGETEHVRIPVGQGICGSAAKDGTTIIVPDVSKDPRYLMCFPSTRSEIVVPIKGKRSVLGEIDIDSDRLSAFTKQDREILENVASILAGHIEK